MLIVDIIDVELRPISRIVYFRKSFSMSHIFLNSFVAFFEPIDPNPPDRKNVNKTSSIPIEDVDPSNAAVEYISAIPKPP